MNTQIIALLFHQSIFLLTISALNLTKQIYGLMITYVDIGRCVHISIGATDSLYCYTPK